MEAALKAIWRAILWARVAHDALNVVADAPVAYGCDQVGLNPSDSVKSSDFAPLASLRPAAHGARDWLGWTAVAQCPTLSAKKFSVSPKISTGDLTNMARSLIPSASRQTRQNTRK